MGSDKKGDGAMSSYQRSAGIRAFTLIEIMIALVIIGVLATIAIPSYLNFIEDGKSQLCATNLEALKSAFDIYMVEHNVVPGDLGQLSPEAIDKAFARAIRTKGWNVKFASFIERREKSGYAFASLVEELGQGNLKMLRCPSDIRHNTTKPSYGINQSISSMSKEDYLNQPENIIIIADSDETIFIGEPLQRHKHSKGIVSPDIYANAITKGGWVKKRGLRGPAPDKCQGLENDLPRMDPSYYQEKGVTRFSKDPNKIKEIKKCWKSCF
jgi:prepilin-type N-terminal cleavage/methylation domain-containing protein